MLTHTHTYVHTYAYIHIQHVLTMVCLLRLDTYIQSVKLPHDILKYIQNIL